MLGRMALLSPNFADSFQMAVRGHAPLETEIEDRQPWMSRKFTRFGSRDYHKTAWYLSKPILVRISDSILIG